MAIKERDKSMGSVGYGDKGFRLDNTWPRTG